MNRHRKLVGSTRVVMGAVAAVALLLGASPVAAHETGAAGGSTPDEVSGTFVAPPPMPVGLREAGGNCFAEVPGDVFVLDGALDGELVLDLRLHFFGPCSAIAFPARFDATGTFTGSVTVGGQQLSGSFDVVFGGRIDEQPIARGRMTIGQGSGGLEGIHGVVDLEGIPGVGGTYAGRVLLAPGT